MQKGALFITYQMENKCLCDKFNRPRSKKCFKNAFWNCQFSRHQTFIQSIMPVIQPLIQSNLSPILLLNLSLNFSLSLSFNLHLTYLPTFQLTSLDLI